MTTRGGKPSRVALAGLGGFVLGAATVLLIVWFYGRGGNLLGPAGPAATAPAAPPPPSAAVQPQPQQQPPAAPLLPAPTPPAPLPPSGALPPADLARRDLLVPVQGVRREDLRDNFTEPRSGGRSHEAIDILAPRNTPVLAVEDGRVAKLFTSAQGGLTVYQFDPTSTYAYYYAHLERYAQGLKEGDPIRRGQVIGYVGTTGNAPPGTPHLHFAIFQLGPERRWWEGTALNPFLYLRGAGTQAGDRPAR